MYSKHGTEYLDYICHQASVDEIQIFAYGTLALLLYHKTWRSGAGNVRGYHENAFTPTSICISMYVRRDIYKIE